MHVRVLRPGEEEEGVWPPGLRDSKGGKKADILKLVNKHLSACYMYHPHNHLSPVICNTSFSLLGNAYFVYGWREVLHCLSAISACTSSNKFERFPWKVCSWTCSIVYSYSQLFSSALQSCLGVWTRMSFVVFLHTSCSVTHSFLPLPLSTSPTPHLSMRPHSLPHHNPSPSKMYPQHSPVHQYTHASLFTISTCSSCSPNDGLVCRGLGAHPHVQPQPSDLVIGSPGGRGLVPGQQSRLNSEFQVLEELGQGGFGDVLKVLPLCLSVLQNWLRLW